MRPVPIPDHLVPEGAERRVIAGPDGDLVGEISPVEALIRLIGVDHGHAMVGIRMRIELEPGDLERLREDPHFWLETLSDHLHPFALELPRRCRTCGCTDVRACVDRVAGGPCSWVADDLCSRCAHPADERLSTDEVDQRGRRGMPPA